MRDPGVYLSHAVADPGVRPANYGASSRMDLPGCGAWALPKCDMAATPWVVGGRCRAPIRLE